MDKEVLRKQVAAEIQSEYETKLREVKRQKSHAEEELEAASERWRSERRKLNTEIDRLEAALNEARGPSRKLRSADSKAAGIDPAEAARIQNAAEEKLKAAEAEWESERVRLTSQVSRLERAVAEAIERSSNPMRSTQPIKEQFEAKLDAAAKDRLLLEQEFLRAKGKWDEEKKKLSGDMIKLRRLAPPSKTLEAMEKLEQLRGRKETLEEVRIRGLEAQLSQAREEAQKYHQTSIDLHDQITQLHQALELAKSGRTKLESNLDRETVQEHESEKARLQTEVQQLKHTLAESRARVSSEETELRRQYDLKLQEITTEKTQVARELQEAAEMLQSERSRLSRELDEELSKARVEVQKYRLASVEADDKRSDWERERHQLQSEIQKLQRALSETRDHVDSDVVEQLRRQYDSTMQEITEQKTHISQRLQAATAILESERSRFSQEASQGEPLSDVTAEVARIESDIQQIVALIDDPSTDLSTVIRKNVEKAELDAYLKGVLFGRGRGKAF